jgi:hypothetical protein
MLCIKGRSWLKVEIFVEGKRFSILRTLEEFLKVLLLLTVLDLALPNCKSEEQTVNWRTKGAPKLRFCEAGGCDAEIVD